MIAITSVSELRLAIDEGEHEFFILLNGSLRSSKNIDFHDSVDKNGNYKFDIVNEIDGSHQVLSEKNLFNKNITLIGEAIEKGAFYRY